LARFAKPHLCNDQPGILSSRLGWDLIMRIVAIVVAAGRGTRAGGEMPKQYRPLGGRPLLSQTLDAFLCHPQVDGVLCAIHPEDRALYDGAVSALRFEPGLKLLAPVHGGETRQISVCRALERLAKQGEPEICLIHDAARPFADAALIGRAIEAGLAYGAAVPGVTPTDTMKRVDPRGLVVETVDRASLRTIQTPQAFGFKRLKDTHQAAELAGLDSFTDDGQLAEWAGLSVHVFAGDPLNMKVTHPLDFAEAERRLGTMVTRVGTGFDVHAFGQGDHIWLGGIRIAHDRGILAHSDGDVALHALTDALLGALSDGDIGTHFPPSDPQWRGASSDRFLAYAVEKVRARGGRIDHLDVTVLAEQPKIGPNREAIRARIAEITDLPLDAVSIKATTTEKLGFTGRAEGIAAQAAATIRLPETL
jgi:2-C-methyl-D-erythritol 4-phosphate cytidylyltransferase/2-C-methyl-D-erythritol 2,4-cyclodiphosphate synthase